MSDKEVRAVAETMFVELVRDAIQTTTMAAYREIKRGRAVCGVCGTRPAAASSRESSPSRGTHGAGSAGPSSRAGGYAVGPERGTGGATGIGSGSGRVDASGNVFFDCIACGRNTASNRYAPHLASCLGLNGSTRRAASRAAHKPRLGTHDRSSPSPYVHSDGGFDSDNDSVGGAKRKKLNGNGKRTLSPVKASAKKGKLGSGTATPSFKSGHVPSRLGRPPTNARRESGSSPPPPSSPAKSLASVAASASGGGGGGAPSMIGRKTVPAPHGAAGAGSTVSASQASIGGSVAGTVYGDADGDDGDGTYGYHDGGDADSVADDATYTAPVDDLSDEPDDDY